MTSGNQNIPTPYSIALTKAAKKDTIVEYKFERSEKSNVLAIHQTRPLIAYLIDINLNQKISKGWSSINDAKQSPSSLINNGPITNGRVSLGGDKSTTVCIRIMDYVTRQRCLTKGIFHARPADCAFTINSIICSKSDIIKLAIVDRLANIYLYDISYFMNELAATRISVIRSPSHYATPYDCINLVWCPFVPCEDFDEGDGGLRLAVSTNSKIEVFAIDRLQGKTGEFQREDLKGGYKCIEGSRGIDILALSLSPDCSTISSATNDNKVTFYSCDLDEAGDICLHSWEAPISKESCISKLFFLDDYPKLLEDSTTQFWGVALVGTRCGQMFIIDLRDWTVNQRVELTSELSIPKNFDYRMDITSRNVMALNSEECFLVQVEHSADSSLTTLPKITRTTKLCSPSRLDLHNNPFITFVIKHKSDTQLLMFTISGSSLDMYLINLNILKTEASPQRTISPSELQKFFQKFDGSVKKEPQQQHKANSMILQTPPHNPRHHNQNSGPTPQQQVQNQQHTSSPLVMQRNKDQSLSTKTEIAQMDKMVEALFSRLNSAFSQGLGEFLTDVKCEVNDLKTKIDGLSRDLNRLNHQLQEIRHK